MAFHVSFFGDPRSAPTLFLQITQTVSRMFKDSYLRSSVVNMPVEVIILLDFPEPER